MQIEHFFSPNLRSDVHPFKLLDGGADVDHSQTIWGDTAKFLGDTSPFVSAPLPEM